MFFLCLSSKGHKIETMLNITIKINRSVVSNPLFNSLSAIKNFSLIPGHWNRTKNDNTFIPLIPVVFAD